MLPWGWTIKQKFINHLKPIITFIIILSSSQLFTEIFQTAPVLLESIKVFLKLAYKWHFIYENQYKSEMLNNPKKISFPHLK